MLPKSNRLHRETEIKNLMHTGQTFFLPELIIKFKRTKQPAVKIAFVVANKVSKKANVRNLLKRRLRHASQEQIAKLPAGLLVAIIARPKSLDLDYAAIKKQIHFAFNKINHRPVKK